MLSCASLPVHAPPATKYDNIACCGPGSKGAGVSRSTKPAYVGTVTWKVTLKAGTLVYAGTPVLVGGKVKVSSAS